MSLGSRIIRYVRDGRTDKSNPTGGGIISVLETIREVPARLTPNCSRKKNEPTTVLEKASDRLTNEQTNRNRRRSLSRKATHLRALNNTGTIFIVLSSRHRYYESSPSSFDECRTESSRRRPSDLVCHSVLVAFCPGGGHFVPWHFVRTPIWRYPCFVYYSQNKVSTGSFMWSGGMSSDKKSQALDFVVNRFLMKLLNTSNLVEINGCWKYFVFELPSELLQGRSQQILMKLYSSHCIDCWYIWL